MATGQVGYPMTFFILVKALNGLVHDELGKGDGVI